MKKYASFILILSMFMVIGVTFMFFIDFKYDPGTKIKVIIIGLYSFLGIKSYSWIKKINKEEKSALEKVDGEQND
ncbi:hypothetical protein [Lactococcus petauri]|uniref:hypothetical protein n=1 Tax=Lactococcus petauri TaxID=1940789 RepID=UPI0018A88E8F|nr:hypothetical protein [Lactococcus petauri]MDC0827048.1 hypothetical protein [Lactococcus petauri]